MAIDATHRVASPRSYLMCPPDFFDVTYAINPWMAPDVPVDRGLARRQWAALRATHESLGHCVGIIDPVPGLPDMVFAANGATVIDGRVLGARFKYPERAPEADAYLSWFRLRGYSCVRDAVAVNEGEGDILIAGDTVLAGYGFRSDIAAADELRAMSGRRVVSLRLVDPRFYHLDTAMCVLDRSTVMYYPAAFDDAGRAALASVFTELIEAKDEDAEVLGLNAVCDGRHVVLAAQAGGLARSLSARGFVPVPVDMSELLKAGGGAKCCTLELRHLAGAIAKSAILSRPPSAISPGGTTPRTPRCEAQGASRPAGVEMTEVTADYAGLTERYSAHNYHPLPVVAESATGVWVTDTGGKRYLDMLAGYSALNFGHRHPQLVAAAMRQLDRVTLVSRAFDHDQFGPFCGELASLCGMEMVLPMNTGAEAVETAIKVARKWGYVTRGVPADQAVIVVFDGNFHGRTTTIVSFSSDAEARDDFGPYTPGFVSVPYGDFSALSAVFAAFRDRVVGVLVEPIQGEAGVVVPPAGFLVRVRELCTSAGALLIADEIQSGLGRVGTTFACEGEGVVPDAYLLGKALGGGIVPVSAMVSARSVLGVLRPGQHGSTFGGNPLACAVAREVIAMLRTGEYQARSAALGAVLHAGLAALPSSVVSAVRGRGLWAGVTFDTLDGRAVCERLARLGVLAKETHGTTIRLAPPLVVTEDELSWGLGRLSEAVLGETALAG
jgi:ornithine--oxo-acid transaminase